MGCVGWEVVVGVYECGGCVGVVDGVVEVGGVRGGGYFLEFRVREWDEYGDYE